MYFSRIRLTEFGAAQPLLLRQIAADNGHRVLWRMFAPDGAPMERSFIYRRLLDARPLTFMAVSKGRPECLDGTFAIESKLYEPILRRGMRLGFSLTANVVKRVAGGNLKGHLVDVVLAEKHALAASGDSEDISPAVLLQRAGVAWLAARGEQRGYSFGEDAVLCEAYRQMRVKRDGKEDARFSLIDYSGILTVTRPEVFTETLMHGMGRGKAFGCGMMMVRRV